MSLTYLWFSFLIGYLGITNVGLLLRLNEKSIHVTLRTLPDKHKIFKRNRGHDDDDNDSDEK